MCQFSPVPGKRTLANVVQVPINVYPVGRLDYDSEGLLLLTNNKKLNAKLLHPNHKVEKEYYVQVEGMITEQALRSLSSGVTINIDGKAYVTQPAQARQLSPPPLLPPRVPPIRYRAQIPTSWISLTLKEGKNRQVRRMTAAVGFPTLRLVRWRLGALTIAGMQPGQYKQLTIAPWEF